MATWQVNAARSHLSEVLDQADCEGPQFVTHHGKERAVVLSMNAYRSLKVVEKPDFISYLLSGPKIDFADFEIERDRFTQIGRLISEAQRELSPRHQRDLRNEEGKPQTRRSAISPETYAPMPYQRADARRTA